MGTDARISFLNFIGASMVTFPQVGCIPPGTGFFRTDLSWARAGVGRILWAALLGGCHLLDACSGLQRPKQRLGQEDLERRLPRKLAPN